MADFSWAAAMSWDAPVRLRVIFAVAALVLAGCNANQAANLSSRTAAGVVAGPDFPGYNAYDPTKYAQTSGFYAGGGTGR